MKDWYNSSWNDVVKELDTDITKGLSEENIEKNRKAFGSNETITIKSKSFINIFIRYILKIHSISGISISIMLFYINEYSIASILLFLILISSSLFTMKDFHNENKLKHLTSITPQKALVIRNGRTVTIPVTELVVGDIVYLEQGDIVPGDLRLIECINLKIKESAITGDNQIVEKYETKIEDREISLGEIKNMAFKSSFVIEGRGKGVAVAVGNKAQIDSITNGLLEVNYIKSQVESNIFKSVNIFSLAFMLSAIAIGIYNISIKADLGKSLELITLAYLIIVPIELIFSVNLISFILKKVMNNKGVEIEGLSSIELLSGNNILFTDKVGKLSEEVMYIDSFYTNGKVVGETEEEIEENRHNLDRIITIGLLCNDSKENFEDIKENLIEKAIIKYGLSNSIQKSVLEKGQERVFQIPYDMEKRIKTTLNRMEDKYRANVMGAVDKLLERCTHIMKNGIEVEITAKDIVDIKDADLSLSLKALHTIGVAYRNFNYQPSINENIESNLVFVGLIGLENPNKEDSIDSIKYCRSLAIKPIVVTDDNKIAAKVFGEKVSILNKNDLVLSGVEMDNMDDAELEKYVERVGIYSRITPKHKWRIASAFNKLGYNVAITGNKFTDLPSFRAAHIGIAMGKECTQMAKKLGDIFVKDNNLLGLLSLIEESRNTIKGMKNIIYFNFIVILIELICVLTAFRLFGESVANLNHIILVNFIGITLSCFIIFLQRNNFTENRYENVKLDLKLPNSITGGLLLYILFVASMDLLMVHLGNTKSLELGISNFFTILNFNSVLLVLYFVHLKDILTSKASSIIMAINILIFISLIKINYSIYGISSRDIIWNLKILIPALILQALILKFSKEISKRS